MDKPAAHQNTATTGEVPPSSLPTNLPVELKGFDDADYKLGQKVGEILYVMGTSLNLERLEGVTIAYDYDTALAEVDRGYKSSHTLTRSAEEGMLGVAMSPLVMRDGSLKARVVFEAGVVEPILDESAHASMRRTCRGEYRAMNENIRFVIRALEVSARVSEQHATRLLAVARD